MVSVVVLGVAQMLFAAAARTQPHAIAQQSSSDQNSRQSIQAKGVEGIWQGTLPKLKRRFHQPPYKSLRTGF